MLKYHDDGTIEIPAAGYGETDKDNRGIEVMRSFDGGLQLRMAPYARAGASVMRGGSWKGDPEGVNSGKRFRAVRLGNYPNFGMRVAVTPNETNPPAEKTLDLGHGITLGRGQSLDLNVFLMFLEDFLDSSIFPGPTHKVSAQQSTSGIFARDLAALASMPPGSPWSGRRRDGP